MVVALTEDELLKMILSLSCTKFKIFNFNYCICICLDILSKSLHFSEVKQYTWTVELKYRFLFFESFIGDKLTIYQDTGISKQNSKTTK